MSTPTPPAPQPDPRQVLRGALGQAVRRGDTARAAELRAELRCLRIERQLAVWLSEVDLSQEQRDRLARLLKPSLNALTGGD